MFVYEEILYVIGREEAILVDCALLDLRLRERDRSPQSQTDESGVYKAQGRDGVDSCSTSIEGNKGKEGEELFEKNPGRTWILVRQSRGWIDNRLGGKINSLGTICRSNAGLI